MGSSEEPDGKPRAGGGFIGQSELLRGDGWGVVLRCGMQDVFDGRDAGDGFLGEDAELQGKRAGQLAVEIDGAAAHARHDAGVLDFRAF